MCIKAAADAGVTVLCQAGYGGWRGIKREYQLTVEIPVKNEYNSIPKQTHVNESTQRSLG